MDRNKDFWSTHIRKPDNDSVDLPWNSDFNPKLFGRIREWDEPYYEHEWKNGMADHLFEWDVIEDEIERVNRKLGL